MPYILPIFGKHFIILLLEVLGRKEPLWRRPFWHRLKNTHINPFQNEQRTKFGRRNCRRQNGRKETELCEKKFTFLSSRIGSTVECEIGRLVLVLVQNRSAASIVCGSGVVLYKLSFACHALR